MGHKEVSTYSANKIWQMVYTDLQSVVVVTWRCAITNAVYTI